jgi:hypothetical protein
MISNASVLNSNFCYAVVKWLIQPYLTRSNRDRPTDDQGRAKNETAVLKLFSAFPPPKQIIFPSSALPRYFLFAQPFFPYLSHRFIPHLYCPFSKKGSSFHIKFPPLSSSHFISLPRTVPRMWGRGDFTIYVWVHPLQSY